MAQPSDLASITIDWLRITSEDELWDCICEKGGEPTWHGRNLDALHDSWVIGGLHDTGPPHAFVFMNIGSIRESLRTAANEVMKIARLSVQINGGSYVAN